MLPLLAPLVLAPVALAGPTVWVVDPLMLPGADFTDVQSAVDAAADGDVILMRFGGYAGFTVDGKSLTIVEDELLGFGATVFGPVIVRNLAADQEVTIRGLELNLLETNVPVRELLVEQCQGPVLLHDMTFVRGNPCVEVALSSVTLSGCTLAGSSNDSVLQEAVGVGLVAANALVNLYDCTVTGGTGADDYFPAHPSLPDTGADAVRLTQATLFASGSSLQGGDGGDGAPGTTLACTSGAKGGNGLRVLDASSSVALLDTDVGGGAGGASGGVGCSPGTAGSAIGPVLTGVVQVPGAARQLSVNTPVREGGVAMLTAQGAPGELAVLLVSDALLGWPYDPDLAGTLVAHPVLTVVVALGLTGETGLLEANFGLPVGKLPPGLEARAHTLQAGMVDLSTLKVRVTSPTALLLLDSAL